MLLDPKIVAEFWLQNWDDNITEGEKKLNGWVDDLVMTALWKNAEYSFAIVEAIHEADKEQKRIEVFAAGPLEEILANHGDALIDRIENKARQDPSFAIVLGGVWKNRMSDAIWERIKAVRNTSTWDDARE